MKNRQYIPTSDIISVAPLSAIYAASAMHGLAKNIIHITIASKLIHSFFMIATLSYFALNYNRRRENG